MIDWNSIKTVFLDMDGTLLDLHFDNYIWLEAMPREYAAVHNIPIKKARDHVKKQINIAYGNLNAYCFRYWDKLLGIDMIKLHAQESHRISYRPNAKLLLKALKKIDVSVFILTNAYPDNLNLKLAITNLEKYVERIYISHDYGYAKEERGFWDEISKMLKFEPNKTLFIDDGLANLRMAKMQGISNLHTILKPCSNSSVQINNEFPAINDFIDIIPQIYKSLVR